MGFWLQRAASRAQVETAEKRSDLLPALRLNRPAGVDQGQLLSLGTKEAREASSSQDAGQ